MRVVVAGGRGFIGAAIVRRARAAGWDVVAAGRGEVEQALATGADALVWAAGRKHADDAANRAEHVDAMATALAAAATPLRVVYLSSGELYGAQAVPFVEDAPLLGESSYANAKRAGEVRARSHGDAIVLRPSIVYGPGQTGAMFVPSAIRRLLAGERLAMTPGDQTRDLVFVDDVADAVVAALATHAPRGTYNISSGIEVALADVAWIIADAIGGDARARVDLGAVPHRAGDQLRYSLDPTRAATALGWRATTALAGGIVLTVDAAKRGAA